MIEIRDMQGAVLLSLAAETLTRANLTGASLFGARLAGADLTRANLAGANLTRANLAGANLTGARLAGADLLRANLAGADLTGARLAGADLTRANLAGALLPFGETWEVYLSEVVPALLTAGGRSLAEVATEAVWSCHTWANCPMAAAFGVSSPAECPVLLRPRVQEFVRFFDAGLIPLAALTGAG